MNSQKLYRYVRQAVDRYGLIEPGDFVAAAVSGGKDSLAMLYALAGLRRFYPIPFTLCAIAIDIGFGMDYSPLERFCQELDVPFHLVPTQIREIVENHPEAAKTCSLCANLRRGALVREAAKLGCTKLALGHHRDDIIQTMMLSMIYEGRFYSISPYTCYEDQSLSLIRPLIYVNENEIKHFTEQNALPVIHNKCPLDHTTARNDMKDLLYELQKRYPKVKDRFFHAIETGSIDDWVQARKRKED